MKLKSFKKVAIANRGEVAVRIIRACQDLGIPTVLLHSEADIGTRAYRMSTDQVCIGPAATNQSYLNVEANVTAALAAGADAVHPGFGFLSENANFARACEAAGLTFIGPTADAIEKMGDKVSARALMEAAGVPVVPGYQGDDSAPARLQKEAERIGFPLIIKAAAGGGGRGLRVVEAPDQFNAALVSAQRESLSSFGSDRVFLEKYIRGAKHIEFQIFGDQLGNIVHLFDRECSVQRRHQKIVEEAPSSSLSDELREKMAQAAVKAAKAVKYIGAGTVEFLVQGNEFYFLEMNTRLQVEHPVTELILGVDLVQAQIQVAQGYRLPWQQHELVPRGHAIECRIYAEDPYKAGMPSTGRLLALEFPEGPGRRFEVGFEAGDEITPFYDPMIAKAIFFDETRLRCINKSIRALGEIVVFGVHSNIPFLQQILDHVEFRDGTMTTQFISQHFAEGLVTPEETEFEKKLGEFLRAQLGRSARFLGQATTQEQNPFSQSWRLP